MQNIVLTRISACDILCVETCDNARNRGGLQMNTQAVKERMKEKNISAPMMAKELGMDQSTYYRKMQKNGDEFSALDLMVFKRVLEMDDTTAISFLLS